MKTFIALTVSLTLAASTHAHHEFYDDVNTGHLIQFGGTITGLEWAEPHVLIRISTDPYLASSQHYLVEVGSPDELLAEGVDMTTLEVLGERVSIIAYSSKSLNNKTERYMYGLYLADSPTNKVLLNQRLYEQLPQVDWPQARRD